MFLPIQMEAEDTRPLEKIPLPEVRHCNPPLPPPPLLLLIGIYCQLLLPFPPSPPHPNYDDDGGGVSCGDVMASPHLCLSVQGPIRSAVEAFPISPAPSTIKACAHLVHHHLYTHTYHYGIGKGRVCPISGPWRRRPGETRRQV